MGELLPFPLQRRDVPHTPKAVITRARKAGLLTDTFEVRAQRSRAKATFEATATPSEARLAYASPELAMILALVTVLDRQGGRAGPQRAGLMLDLHEAAKEVTARWDGDAERIYAFQARNTLSALWARLAKEAHRGRETLA